MHGSINLLSQVEQETPAQTGTGATRLQSLKEEALAAEAQVRKLLHQLATEEALEAEEFAQTRTMPAEEPVVGQLLHDQVPLSLEERAAVREDAVLLSGGGDEEVEENRGKSIRNSGK